jgi:hypothetical protein
MAVLDARAVSISCSFEPSGTTIRHYDAGTRIDQHAKLCFDN